MAATKKASVDICAVTLKISISEPNRRIGPRCSCFFAFARSKAALLIRFVRLQQQMDAAKPNKKRANKPSPSQRKQTEKPYKRASRKEFEHPLTALAVDR